MKSPETDHPAKENLRLVDPPTISRYEALLNEPGQFRLVDDRVPYLFVVRTPKGTPEAPTPGSANSA